MCKGLAILNRELPTTELCRLGGQFGTDKPDHGYTRVYYEIMRQSRLKAVNLFEIGIYLGSSLKMWESFFPNGNIFGIDNGRKVFKGDIKFGNRNETPTEDDLRLLRTGQLGNPNDFNWIETNRIRCFIADQRSKKQLKQAFKYFNCKEFDFILDDGQHYQEHQQKSLGLLFKYIKSGGYYIIEDVCTQSLLLQGCFWEQKKNDCTDSTDFVFRTFIETGIFSNEYVTEKEAKYIEDNTGDVFMYDSVGKNNSPVSGTSKLVIIKKK